MARAFSTAERREYVRAVIRITKHQGRLTTSDAMKKLGLSRDTVLKYTGVNMGPRVSTTFLQRWLTSLNQRGKLYPDLKPDGVIGNITIAALRSYLAVRGSAGVTVILKGLNCSQGARYLELAEAREANEEFLFGWVKERVNL